MGATTNYTLPYPEGVTPPNVDGDIKALADATDGALQTVEGLLAPSGTRMLQTVAQTIGSGVTAVVALHTVSHNDGYASLVTNKAIVPAGKAGRHLIIGRVSLASLATTARLLIIVTINGSSATNIRSEQAGSGAPAAQVSDVVDLAVGDELQLTVFQNSGSSVNTSVVAGNQSSLTVERMGR